MSTRKQKVALFWPEERIEALKTYAQDTSEDLEAFERSKRFAWMREFCMSAPSWLVADSVRLRLKVRVQDALAKAAEVHAELLGLHSALETMAPLEDTFQDKWASRIVNAPNEPANPPEPVREPEPVAKVAAPGEKLPGELAFDLAHGKTYERKMEPPLRERIAKMAPDALARALGPHAKKPVPVEETEEEHTARVGHPQAESENFEDEHIIVPNPDEEMPEDRPKKRAKAAPKSDAATVAQRAATNGADAAADEVGETVAVKRADGKIMHRKPRMGFRMVLKQVADKHGEEVADYLVSDILGGKATTLAIRQAMERFMGTFDTYAQAQSNCADAQGLDDGQEREDFQFDLHASHILSHEDGRCSWWAKAA